MGKKPHFTQERLEECVDENGGFVKCPECEEEFDTSQGVSLHYGYNHEGSISNLFRCKECGRLKFGIGQKNTFCSKWCETYSRVGTFKHLDREYLENKIVNENLRSVDVAEELGLKKSLVHKWVRKYEIGNEYPCPSCQKSFATKQGVSKHHKDKHGESISGTTYTCDYCGEKSWTRKSRDDSSYPRYCDDDCFGASMTGEDNPNKDKDRREKISQTMRENYREGDTQHSERDREWMMENVVNNRDNDYLYEGNNVINDHLISEPIFVEETGRMVRSSWEEEIDLMLYDSGFDYDYEPKRFDIGDRKYMPDFIVESEVVVEVKGYVSEASLEKAESFMAEYPDYTYVVVGSEIPCDKYVPWEERNEFVDRIKKILR